MEGAGSQVNGSSQNHAVRALQRESGEGRGGTESNMMGKRDSDWGNRKGEGWGGGGGGSPVMTPYYKQACIQTQC